MTNYKRGRSKEYETIRILEDQGYHAYRTAGSHGPFDVLAFNGAHFRLIQVKYGSRPRLSPKEVKKIKSMSFPKGTILEVWMFTVGIKEPTIETV